MSLLVMRQLPSPLAKATGIVFQPGSFRTNATSVCPSPLKSPVSTCTPLVAAQPAKSPMSLLVTRQLPSPMAKATGIVVQPGYVGTNATSVRPSPLKSPVTTSVPLLYAAQETKKYSISPSVTAQPAAIEGVLINIHRANSTKQVVKTRCIDGFMVLPFFFPLCWIQLVAGPEGAKNLAGRGVLRLIQIRLATPSFEKPRWVVKTIRRKRESPIPIPQMPSTFHHYARRLLCETVMQLTSSACSTSEAEGVRFELTRPFGLPVFKTGAINRSATPPDQARIRDRKIHYSITPLLQVKS